ncbi:hybrid signal transduction histidine kinase A, partial [Aspergillus udagawae]
ATVALPPSSRDSKEYSFLVVNDLQESEPYKNVSFVTDGPRFRFYAGTPLTTETKINIGCFFALDIKPRDSFSDSEKEIFGSLGMLIMDYLQVSRQASEGRRAARLSRGLSYFVEGSSSFVDPHPSSYTGSSAPTLSTPASSGVRANHLSGGSSQSFEHPSKRSHSVDARSTSSVSDSKADNGDQNNSSWPDTPLPDWWAGSRRKGLTLDESHSSSWAFRRAANLLRESLELDADGGVIFLEVNNSHMLDVETGSDCSGENGPAAPVLAVSTRDEPFAPGPGSTVLYPAANLDSGFLHQLLRRYTKGKLWYFHRDGILSSSDDEKPNGNHSKGINPAEPPRGSGKKWKQSENAMLNLFFPNATQVMFVPLWNAANSQWFAGCFCWNTVESRVFSRSVELSSVLGFGSSIMAECNRVQSLISDRQKGDFIGSISHELRSPLHGILAATEFLHGTDLDEFQLSLLETINACGRTLLDTMNQVLDFSKIVSLERTWRQLKRNKTELTNMDKISAHLDTFVTTDLAVLAEEVVEGVCLGHTYGQKSMASADQSVLLPNSAAAFSLSRRKPKPDTSAEVEVVMDIAQNNWVYRTQPGALRRIIMNVFGNAMKYTESGRVSVHLEVTEASEIRSRRHGVEELVTLTVSDTGKGISEAFLRGRLFTPFAQEDTLAVGTGLGLSIVRSLVKALNGTINVHSRPGEGTTVKVSLPLTRPNLEDRLEDSLTPPSVPSRQDDTMNEACSLRDSHSGRRVAILGVEPADALEHRFWSVIARYLTDWYDLELVSSASQEPIDVLLADEESLASISKEAVTGILPSLLILCNKSVDYSAIRTQWSPIAAFVDIIRRPCGPHKLARCIRKCLDNGPRGGVALPPRIELPERPRMSSGSASPCPDLTDADPLAATGDYTPATSMRPGSLSSEDSGKSQSSSDIVEVPHGSDTSMSPLFTPSETACKRVERKARVLVVDDNPINLNLMLTFMKKRDLEVLDSAENGKLAVDAVERLQQGYDLVFMDMSMPVMNGFEATRAIRALEKERDGCGPATIIALTGLSSTRDESEAITSGVDLFLTKPVSFKEVSRLLDEWAERGLRDRKSPSPSPSAS